MAYQGNPAYPAGPPAVPYSDWLVRVGASLIDAAPIIAVWIVVYILEFAIGSFVVDILLTLVVFAAAIGYWVYNRLILGGQGQTIGKKMLNIKLISEETGQPIGTMNAFVRDICHFVDGIPCGVGYLAPLWEAKRQTWADKIMNTVVVPA